MSFSLILKHQISILKHQIYFISLLRVVGKRLPHVGDRQNQVAPSEQPAQLGRPRLVKPSKTMVLKHPVQLNKIYIPCIVEKKLLQTQRLTGYSTAWAA